jgi:hypothetical protein
MNPQGQAFETTPAGENPAGDRKRLLALSVTAVLLVDAGLAVMLLDDKNLVSRAAAVITQIGDAPGHSTGPLRRWTAR